MSNDLTMGAIHEIEQQGETPTGASMLEVVWQAARDPGVNADKMQALANLAMQLQDREAVRRYRAAKAAAQAAMPSIGKRGEVLNKQGRVQSRFSHFETLHSVCVPILAAHNLTLDFRIGETHQVSGGFMIPVEAQLTYSDGEMVFVEGGGALPFPIDNMGGKSPVQGVASSLSMGKRHTMKAMLNIREHDANEGESGGGHAPQITDAEQVLIEEARSAALEGVAAYQKHWSALNAQQKAFLVSRRNDAGETYHDANKAAAELAS